MASKPKNINEYIVLRRAKTKKYGCTVIGRYRVCAKNEKEAIEIAGENIGKHCKLDSFQAREKEGLKYREFIIETEKEH